MNNDVTIRLAGQVVVPNAEGELEFESGAGTKTKIVAEEVHKRLLQAQSLEEAFEFLQSSGAYIGADGSRVMIVQTPNGAQIFAKDEPSRKIVVDRELPEAAIQQILSINDYDNGRAVEKILLEHGIIDNTRDEMEEVITSDIDNRSFEREARDVGRGDNTEGLIGEARVARDNLEDPNRGIYSEQEYAERRRREREAQERSGMDR